MKRLTILTVLVCAYQLVPAQESEVKEFGVHSVNLGYVTSWIYYVGAPFGCEANLSFFRSGHIRADAGFAFRYTGTEIYQSRNVVTFEEPGYYSESTERYFEAQIKISYKVLNMKRFQLHAGPVVRIGKHYAHVVESPWIYTGALVEYNKKVSYRGAGLLFKQYYGDGDKWQIYSAQSINWDYFHPYDFTTDTDFRLGVEYTLFHSQKKK